MVSIKDIAAVCGVSIATVSKALNNHDDVSDNTKKLVRDTAKSLGYMPNAQARALKTNKTYNIGVLLEDKAGSGFTHSYFSAVLQSFKVEVEKFGYDITFISNRIGNTALSYLEHCRYRGVDGVLAACVDFESPQVIQLLESDIPIVTIDYVSDSHFSVCSDNALGMRQIAEYIVSMGHRNIAYICGEPSQVTSLRLDSFRSAMKNFGIDFCDDMIFQGVYHDVLSTEKITSHILNLEKRPTCIVVPDDFSAAGAFAAIRSAGLSVPHDISVVGYDGLRMGQLVSPRLTTVRQNTSIIGEHAARLLISIIKKENLSFDNEFLNVKGEFIRGESVGCPTE